ncbi:class I SAM-dependent methyltransferase [Methylobacterium sp. NMS12]|uniref:class I SAM-dependent methyltransferase n=1 Tax=Methylobacterium sp. NMS12 TaxID=3079766 RepID=UPI003F884E99
MDSSNAARTPTFDQPDIADSDRVAAIEAKLDNLVERISALQTHFYYDSINWNNFRSRFDRFVLECEDRQRDILEALIRKSEIKPANVRVVTRNALADDTPDHLFPRGTAADNTRSPRFVAACEAHFGSPLRHLDIGSAGGGLVWDFTQRGHFSIGIEGSDWSRKEQRAEWRTIPDRLFTADVRFPFRVEDKTGACQQFDLVTAWELFEHIPEADLPTLLYSIRGHLRPGGVVVASIATFADRDEAGHDFHATIRDRAWWEGVFTASGLIPIESPFQLRDYPRGSGNPRAHDWDAHANPELGFHIVARRRPEQSQGLGE